MANAAAADDDDDEDDCDAEARTWVVIMVETKRITCDKSLAKLRRVYSPVNPIDSTQETPRPSLEQSGCKPKLCARSLGS